MQHQVVAEPNDVSRTFPVPAPGTIKLPGEGARPAGQILTTRTGLRFPKNVSFDAWERAGLQISRIVDSFAWCIGDWLVYGQLRYPDRYRQAVEAVGLDYQTLRNYASVARRVDIGRRRWRLSFQHHSEVASLPDTDQEEWLTRAEEGGWSRNQLRQHLRDGRRRRRPAPTITRLPPLAAEQEQVERWRCAAAQSGIEFERWILTALDRAAAHNPEPNADNPGKF
jgi:hypothetical protein